MSEGGELMKALRWLTIATVVLYLSMAALAGYFRYESGQSRADIREVAYTTGEALCSLKSDFRVRLEVAKEFLQDHPDGIPGIPAAVIKDGIRQQEITLKALEPLQCPVPSL